MCLFRLFQRFFHGAEFRLPRRQRLLRLLRGWESERAAERFFLGFFRLQRGLEPVSLLLRTLCRVFRFFQRNLSLFSLFLQPRFPFALRPERHKTLRQFFLFLAQSRARFLHAAFQQLDCSAAVQIPKHRLRRRTQVGGVRLVLCLCFLRAETGLFQFFAEFLAFGFQPPDFRLVRRAFRRRRLVRMRRGAADRARLAVREFFRHQPGLLPQENGVGFLRPAPRFQIARFRRTITLFQLLPRGMAANDLLRFFPYGRQRGGILLLRPRLGLTRHAPGFRVFERFQFAREPVQRSFEAVPPALEITTLLLRVFKFFLNLRRALLCGAHFFILRQRGGKPGGFCFQFRAPGFFRSFRVQRPGKRGKLRGQAVDPLLRFRDGAAQAAGGGLFAQIRLLRRENEILRALRAPQLLPRLLHFFRPVFQFSGARPCLFQLLKRPVPLFRLRNPRSQIGGEVLCLLFPDVRLRRLLFIRRNGRGHLFQQSARKVHVVLPGKPFERLVGQNDSVRARGRGVLQDGTRVFLHLRAEILRTLLQAVLHTAVQPRIEHAAENLGAFGTSGEQQFQEFPLRNHRGLAELAAVDPHQLFHLPRHGGGARTDRAVRPDQFGFGVFRRHAAAPFRALVTRVPLDPVTLAPVGKGQLHKRFLRRISKIAPQRFRRARGAARFSVQRKRDGVENRRLARARVAADEEQPFRAELFERHLRALGIRAERIHHKQDRLHSSASSAARTALSSSGLSSSGNSCSFWFR